MGILYQAGDMSYWAIWLFVLFALMALNEFGRTSKWGGITLFAYRPHRFNCVRMADNCGAWQRIRHGHVVQLGEDVFGAGGLSRVYGASFRPLERRRRQNSLSL